MFTRNRELFWQLATTLALVAVATLLAYLEFGRSGAEHVLIFTGAIGVASLAFTYRRYRRIGDLAHRIDAALGGERELVLSDMREGELAVLATEVDKTFSRLTLANADLEREKVALADALADISHQLRTPLTSLGIELELARAHETDAEQARRIADADRLLERVQWLVSALLKLARLDAGVIELARAEVSVAELVGEAFSQLAVSFDLADVRLDAEVDEDASFVGDVAWSREALVNVLKNCLEHSPSGGAVRVRVTEDALACRIVVSDEGPGIADEDLPHVFERFYRGDDKDVSPNPSGVGIGLSLAKALVTAQNGTMRAGNGKDGGARFEIAFFKAVV